MSRLTLPELRDRELGIVCEKHGVTLEQLRAGRGPLSVSDARHEAMFRLRCLGLSYARIGQRLGGRHHTTCIYGAQTYAKRHGIPLERLDQGLQHVSHATDAVMQKLESQHGN